MRFEELYTPTMEERRRKEQDRFMAIIGIVVVIALFAAMWYVITDNGGVRSMIEDEQNRIIEAY